MVTAENLTVEEHIFMQSAIQRWVDASVSKTINVPKETSYEEFIRVYELAYNSGCKGCTTYRPSDVRGSVLSTSADNGSPGAQSASAEGFGSGLLADRAPVLSGYTYKVKWPRRKAALYLTVNHDSHGTPHEVFITSKDSSFSEWTTALTLMITAIMRKGGDIAFIPKELKSIDSTTDGTFINGKYYGSLPAYLGEILEQHLTISPDTVAILKAPELVNITTPQDAQPQSVASHSTGELCPSCRTLNLHHQEGCKKCYNCGFSSCN
jgi:ribonucleoside-diphosphate reductase alpha chain